MGQKTGAFNDVQLVIAWVFTGLQLFAVAWFFDQITPFYAGMMLANSLIVTVLMAQRRPRRLHNLLPLAQRLFLMGLAGFFVSGTVAMLAPRSFVERYPFFFGGFVVRGGDVGDASGDHLSVRGLLGIGRVVHSPASIAAK